MNLRALLMILWTMVWTGIGIAVMIIDLTGRLYMWLGKAGWSPQVLWIAGVKVRVKGGEGIDWRKPHIVVANHQSQVDIPVLFMTVPTGIRFLAKRSLFYIPVFGWSLWIARFVPVDRGSGRKARRSIDVAAKRIKKGPSLIVFPEGTRSPDGEIKSFKSGAFVMGIKAGVPILPVALRGTYDIVPKSTMKVKPGKVEVVFGSPIECEGKTMKDKEDLRRLAQARVEEMFETGEPV